MQEDTADRTFQPWDEFDTEFFHGVDAPTTFSELQEGIDKVNADARIADSQTRLRRPDGGEIPESAAEYVQATEREEKQRNREDNARMFADMLGVTDADSGKKRTPDNAPSEENEMNKCDAKSSTAEPKAQGKPPKTKAIVQHFENLPAEIRDAPRYFRVKRDKVPILTDWSNPDKQNHHAKIKGYVGFDTCGHDRAPDYLFLDFDHVTDTDGNFVNDLARRWYNFVQSQLQGFCERSCSKTGLHILAIPTAGKFESRNAGSRGTLYFGKHDTPEEKKTCPKLEIFYLSRARYCFVTGDLFDNCKPSITEGVDVDNVFEALLAEIDRQNQPANTARLDFSADTKSTAETSRDDDPDKTVSPSSSDDDRAIMTAIFATVKAANCDYHDWRDLGMVARLVGVPFEEFDAWSAQDTTTGGDGEPRYNQVKVKYFWEHYQPDDTHRAKLKKIGSAIELAKKYGYTPPRRAPKLPIDLKRPDNVTYSHNSIYVEGGTEKNPKVIVAARTLILPTKKLINHGGGGLRFEVSICQPNGKWTRAIVPARTLQDTARIFELTEHGAIIGNPKVLRDFFSELLAMPENDELIPTVTIYNRPGWHSDKFIYPTPAEGDNYRVERAGINYEKIFSVQGDKEKWLYQFVRITSGTQGALKRGVIGACLLAPALKVVKIPNPQFNLWGSSNIGKTPLLKFGLSIFGNPAGGKLMRTWNATAKNMLTMSAGLNDFPLYVDETESMSRRTQDSLQEYVYNYSIGVIGQTNKRNTNANEAEEFRGVRFSTGERPLHDISDKRGAYKRLTDLHVAELIFTDDSARNLHLFVAENHGLFGRQWTQYIVEHQDEIAKDFDWTADHFTRHGFYRDGLHADFSSVDATNARAVIGCFVAFYHFSKCVGIDPAVDFDKLCADAAQLLEQLPTVEEINDVNRSLQMLASWIVENPNRFITPQQKDGYPIDGYDNPATSYASTVGKEFANGDIGFFANAFRKIVEEIGLPSYDKLLSDLYDADALDCPSRRDKQKQRKIFGKNTKLYIIKREAIFPEEKTTE